MNNKSMYLMAGLIVTIIIVLASSVVMMAGGGSEKKTKDSSTAVVANGETQTINIKARGGYAPRQVTAQAGVATTLNVTTQNTFDCSSALVIRKLGFNKLLPPTGTETISIPASKATGKIVGTCTMGMYSFTINFK